MKKKKNLVPRAALKCLVEDINSMIDSQEKKLHILEAIEEIPFENRNQVFEALSSFYTPQMIEFFRLLLAEYGREMEPLVSRAIDKYSLAGMDVSKPAPSTADFTRPMPAAAGIPAESPWTWPGRLKSEGCRWSVFT